MDKKIILLAVLLLAISACTFGNGNGESLEFPQEISQWAIAAEASDAYGGLRGQNQDDQSPYAATGTPDVEVCGDYPTAWVISEEDDGLHWLELKYYDKVYVSGVRVIESFNPGALVKVELKNGSDYVTFWEGRYETRDCPYTFEKDYVFTEGNTTRNMTSFRTDIVRITLDTDVPGWNEVDAVELLGYENQWEIFNNTVHIIN